jgi:hypothetical protein
MRVSFWIAPGRSNTVRIFYSQGFGKMAWDVGITQDGKVAGFTASTLAEGQALSPK